MKFGVMFANTGPRALPEFAAEMATAAEDLGFESLWTAEHVVVPAGYETPYPYSRSGRMPGPEDVPIPDPLVWLSWVAAKTSRVRLCTGVLILPQRNPVVLAKEVATLDVLSGGRVTLGVGVGWLREEFEILGVPFESRAQRAEDAIKAMRALWTQDPASFHGTHVDFEGARSHPQPAQPGGVPIVVGGHSPVAAARAGRLGDGFFPAKGDPDVLPGLFDTMRQAAREAGRDPDAIELTAGSRRDADAVRRLADLGVHRVVIAPPAFDPAGLRAGLGHFADDVMSKVR